MASTAMCKTAIPPRHHTALGYHHGKSGRDEGNGGTIHRADGISEIDLFL